MAREERWIAIGWLTTILLFGATVLAELPHAHFEDDLAWYLPVIDAATRDRSLFEALAFLVDPRNGEYGPLSLNLHVAAILRAAGPRIEAFLAASLLLHGAIAILVFFLARALRLPPTWAHAASMLMVVSAAHADSWRWSMAAQHQHVVLMALAAVLGAVMTERRIREGRPARGWRVLAFAAAAVGSFCRISSLVIPAAFLALVAVGSSGSERRAGAARWWPVALLWLGYPLVELLVIHPRTLEFLTGPAGGIASLRGLAALALGLPGFLATLGSQASSLILPGGLVGSYFNRYRWHALPVAGPGDTVTIVLGAALLVALALLVLRDRSWAALAGWLAATAFFLAGSDSIFVESGRRAVPSRYFLYTAPGVILVSVRLVREIWLGVASRIEARWLLPFRAIRAAFLLVLVVANVDAFAEQAFRSRAVAAYTVYESLRAGALAGAGLRAQGEGVIRIQGTAPLPHEHRYGRFIRHTWDPDFTGSAAAWRAAGYPADFAIRWDRDREDSPGMSADGLLTCRASSLSFTDASGRELDPFLARWTAGLGALAAGETTLARGHLEEAVRVRPFLLRHLLGARPLSDIPRITGGGPLGPWLVDLERTHLALLPHSRDPADPGLRRTSALMAGEVMAYCQVLEALGRLEDAEGRDGSRLRESRRFLVPDTQ